MVVGRRLPFLLRFGNFSAAMFNFGRGDDCFVFLFFSLIIFPRKFLCVSINDDRPWNSCCKGIKDIVDQTVRQLQKELKVARASQLGKGKLIVFFCFNPSVQSARNMKRSKIEGWKDEFCFWKGFLYFQYGRIELCFLRIQSFGPRKHQIRNQRNGDCKQEVCHGTIQLGSIIYFTPKTIESLFIKETQLSWYCWWFRNPARKPPGMVQANPCK